MQLKQFFGRYERIILPLLAIVLAFVIWDLYVEVTQIGSWLLPSPRGVFGFIFTYHDYIFRHVLVSLFETLVGFGVALIVGIALALGVVYSKKFELTAMPLIVMSQTFPRIALAPLFVVFLGFGLLSKTLMAFFMSFFPVMINTVLGLKSVEPELLELMTMLKASGYDTLVKGRFPSALPHLLVGAKISMTSALIGVIITEFVASNEGLGYLIIRSQIAFDTTQMFASILLLVVIGVSLYTMMVYIERLVIPWHYEKRKTQ